jgi:hypothetical protein
MKKLIIIISFMLITNCTTTGNIKKNVRINGKKASLEYTGQSTVRVAFITYIDVDVAGVDKKYVYEYANRKSTDLNQRWGEIIQNLTRVKELDKVKHSVILTNARK